MNGDVGMFWFILHWPTNNDRMNQLNLDTLSIPHNLLQAMLSVSSLNTHLKAELQLLCMEMD